jgi:sugar phosphate isomerase/epimerase
MLKASMCSIGFQEKDKWKPNPIVQTPLRTVIDHCARSGIAGVEIWEPHYGSLDEAARTDARAAIARAGLAVPMISSYYNFTKSVEHARESLAKGHAVINEAAELSAHNIRIFTGNHRSADASPEQWHRCVVCLRELADHAAEVGVGLAAETHDWNLMDTVPGCLELVNRVDRPNFGFIYQASTFGLGQWAWAMDQLKPWIRHAHLTNPGFLGDGPYPWPLICQRLADHGIDGFCSIEWFGSRADSKVAIDGPWLQRLLQRIG